MQLIKIGSTDQSVMIRFLDSTDGTPETGVVAATTGLTVTYHVTGHAAVVLNAGSTPAINDLALLTTAHTDAGILHVADGWYRFDLPDNAVHAGVNCTVTATADGMVGFGTVLQLVAFDPQSTTNLGLSSIPSASSAGVGGLPILGTNATGMSFDGQVKITATSAGSGALHIVNNSATGHGVYSETAATDSAHAGQYNTGGVGQMNMGSNIGQENNGGIAGSYGQYNYSGTGQFNEGNYTYGQRNEGVISAVYIESSTGPSLDIQNNIAEQPTLRVQHKTTAGDAVQFLSASGNGLQVTGGKAGAGVNVTAGLTGIGVNITGGSTSGDGVKIATTDGDGLSIAALGVGQYDVSIATMSPATESYAAHEAAATPIELLYMIWSFLQEKGVVTTTVTTNKLDGSTSAMTFTLDSATDPTTITRAT